MRKTDRRKRIWRKTGGRCAHCGKIVKGRDATIDHFVPQSRGGDYDIRNLMPLCRRCNEDKRAKDINPYTYYKYAPEDVIKDCERYKREWRQARQSAAGHNWTD